MLAIARKQYIREQLQINKSVRILDLASELNVTKETIRRDLREMEQDGELMRTHGGAYILDGVQNDIDISTRQVLKTVEKEIIAAKCAELIHPGDNIYLDGSTTAWCIARQLVRSNISVLTCSLEIANILAPSDTVRLFMVGGEYSSSTMGFTGTSAIRNLMNYHVDKAFISCRNVSLENGLTDTNDTEAQMHALALDHARERYLAIDNTKLDRTSFAHVADLSILDGIIMDRMFPDRWLQYLTAHNIRVY